jgi:hypothetical protein
LSTTSTSEPNAQEEEATISNQANWHDDIAYWAMATGKVSGFVNTLASAYDSTASSAKGLVCSNGICSSPAAIEIKRRLLQDGDSVWTHRSLQSSASSGIYNPCTSPIVKIRDRAQTVVVSIPPPEMDTVNAQYLQSRSLLLSSNWTLPSWACAYTSGTVDVEVEYVVAEPFGGFQGLKNASSSSLFRNSFEFPGRAVLIERGAPYSFADKASAAASAGASAILFVDDDRSMCGTLSNTKFDQGCVRGGDKQRGVGFAASDNEILWYKARGVPILLVTRDAGLALVKLSKS